jgi:hypothetical protein
VPLPAWSLALGALATVALVALAIAARRRSGWRPWLADAAWLALPLLPVLNIVPLGYTTLVAERFVYAAGIGAAALLGRALLGLAGAGRTPRLAAAAAGVALAAAWAWTSAAHVAHFASETALWTYESRLQPDRPLLHLYLAQALWRDGRLAAASAAARTALLRARHPETQAEAAIAWATLRLELLGDAEQPALHELRRAFDALATPGAVAVLRLGDTDVHLEPPPAARDRLAATSAFRNARAIAHARSLDLEGAEPLFAALARERGESAAFGGLARVQALSGRWDEAARTLEAGTARHPHDPALADLQALVTRGRGLAAAADPLARAVGEARLQAALGSPALAHRTLAAAAAAHPTQRAALEAEARALERQAAPVPTIAAPRRLDDLFR